MPLFRALAKNMAPMTNADESPTNRLTLFPIYLSLFIVSTLWLNGEPLSDLTIAGMPCTANILSSLGITTEAFVELTMGHSI